MKFGEFKTKACKQFRVTVVYGPVFQGAACLSCFLPTAFLGMVLLIINKRFQKIAKAWTLFFFYSSRDVLTFLAYSYFL